MKRVHHLVVFFTFLIYGSLAGALPEKPYHPFTLKDGRNIDARILAFDSKAGKINMERHNLKKGWVSPDIFSENSQKYIQEWVTADNFLSSNVIISTEKKSENGKKYFNVFMENQTHSSLSNITIVCHIYEKSYGVRGRAAHYRCCEEVEFLIHEIQTGEKVVQTTSPRLAGRSYSKEKIEILYVGSGEIESETVKTKISDTRIEGIWIKAFGPSLNGEPAVKEFCEPNDLRNRVTWAYYSDEKDCPKPPTLDFIKRRGKASSQEEFEAWFRELRNITSHSKVTAEQVAKASDGMALFYEAKYDRSVGCANYFAHYCNDHGLLQHEVNWLEKISNSVYAKESQVCDANTKLAELYTSSPKSPIYNTSKAIKFAERALKMDRNDYKLLNNLARTYALDGQFEQAVNNQKKALSRLPEHLKEREYYGKAYRTRLMLYQKKRTE
jgi:tetratricopeptide (TPR) repeat protein